MNALLADVPRCRSACHRAASARRMSLGAMARLYKRLRCGSQLPKHGHASGGEFCVQANGRRRSPQLPAGPTSPSETSAAARPHPLCASPRPAGAPRGGAAPGYAAQATESFESSTEKAPQTKTARRRASALCQTMRRRPPSPSNPQRKKAAQKRQRVRASLNAPTYLESSAGGCLK